jgi:hypothetical protein
MHREMLVLEKEGAPYSTVVVESASALCKPLNLNYYSNQYFSATYTTLRNRPPVASHIIRDLCFVSSFLKIEKTTRVLGHLEKIYYKKIQSY